MLHVKVKQLTVQSTDVNQQVGSCAMLHSSNPHVFNVKYASMCIVFTLSSECDKGGTNCSILYVIATPQEYTLDK